MFNLKYEERWQYWSDFRKSLETSLDPMQDVIDLYNKAPLVTIATDPYSQSTWPDPWELLKENNYCPFVKILAICYTLQLSDVFSQASYEIHIVRDNAKCSTYYLLYVNSVVIGFTGDTYVHKNDIPRTAYSEIEYKMPSLQ